MTGISAFTSPALGYLPEANFFETPSAGARLLSAGLIRAPAVQGWGLDRHTPNNAISSVEIRIDLGSSFFIREMEQDDNQSDQRGNLRHDVPQVGEAGLFNLGDVVFVYRLLTVLVLERFQVLKDLIQRELVLQIDLIIDFCAQPIFVRLPILRHQNNWRLQYGKNVNRSAHQQERIWIEADFANPGQPHVYPYPNVDDELPRQE